MMSGLVAGRPVEACHTIRADACSAGFADRLPVELQSDGNGRSRTYSSMIREFHASCAARLPIAAAPAPFGPTLDLVSPSC
jgi:hypothetical protein